MQRSTAPASGLVETARHVAGALKALLAFVVITALLTAFLMFPIPLALVLEALHLPLVARVLVMAPVVIGAYMHAYEQMLRGWRPERTPVAKPARPVALPRAYLVRDRRR